MSDEKTVTEEPETVADDSTFNEAQQDRLKSMFGSQSQDWNLTLADQVLSTMWLAQSDQDKRQRQMGAMEAALASIAPTDELEGMMAAQLFAAHNATMECYRRAMGGEQTFEGRRENLSQANKLSRTWVTLLEALNKHRGVSQQKVTVEHVHVHAGGQAVVGVVEASIDGELSELKEQPHAKQIAHAPESALPCPDAVGDALPVACDDERPLPNARGKLPRRSNR